MDADGRVVGADRPGLLATTFSFHPVKLVAAGEGGAIAVGNAADATRLRSLRSHAMVRNPERPAEYQVTDLGYNHRLSDLHAALGTAQLGRLSAKIDERKALAERYGHAFAPVEELHWVAPEPQTESAWHLASILVAADRRWEILEALQKAGIGAVNHYPPAHRQPTFSEFAPFGALARSESYCARQITLPLYEGLTDAEQDHVIRTVLTLVQP